jgi:hypothetical protein
MFYGCGEVWGKEMSWWAHTKASFPMPRGPATGWYSIKQSLFWAWGGELRE